MLDIAPERRYVFRRRYFECAAVACGIDALDDAFAERFRTDQRAGFVILNRTGRNFRSTGRVFVDEDDERNGADRFVGGVAARRSARAIDRRDDRARWDEEAGNLDGRLEQAPAVIAEIQDVATDVLRFSGQHRLAHFVVRGLAEVGQTDVIVAVLGHFGMHRRNVDLLAHDRDRTRATGADRFYDQHDGGADLAPDQMLDIVER